MRQTKSFLEHSEVDLIEEINILESGAAEDALVS